ncbi:MAG: hypothetical protein SCABRO_00200 [Candidatus Scalindua brodae]|uniref:Uncharacterized protein n=1 Tax=Candidatus Scalindua brodae TaxID=237368 RepID=A0A0B0ELY4_9BACT|nr:MAG: hypothetical protein SCABRO_00200 [Candidatus Scalindua brodae]
MSTFLRSQPKTCQVVTIHYSNYLLQMKINVYCVMLRKTNLPGTDHQSFSNYIDGKTVLYFPYSPPLILTA